MRHCYPGALVSSLLAKTSFQGDVEGNKVSPAPPTDHTIPVPSSAPHHACAPDPLECTPEFPCLPCSEGPKTERSARGVTSPAPHVLEPSAHRIELRQSSAWASQNTVVLIVQAIFYFFFPLHICSSSKRGHSLKSFSLNKHTPLPPPPFFFLQIQAQKGGSLCKRQLSQWHTSASRG